MGRLIKGDGTARGGFSDDVVPATVYVKRGAQPVVVISCGDDGFLNISVSVEFCKQLDDDDCALLEKSLGTVLESFVTELGRWMKS